jgi:hypothetical protein
MPDYPKYQGWPDGENNILDATELPITALRRCINFDVTNSGYLHRRRGRTQVHVGTPVPNTLWSNGQRVLFVESGNLWELVKISGTWTPMLVRMGMGNHPMAYLDVNRNIYYSNGLFTGMLDPDGADLPWGIAGPQNQPTLTAAASGGDLVTGDYQVAITFVDDLGQESGTPVAAVTSVTGPSGSILLTDLPTAVDGSTIQVYCSAANGEGLYRVGRAINGAPSYRIASVANAQTMMLQTQHGIKPPAGSILEYHNGRIYIAQRNVVWYTEPLRYGMVKPHRGFLMFPEDVTIVKAVADGIYICADQTYWVSGVDTSEFQQVAILPFGGVKGTGISLPESDNVAWFSKEGIMIGGLESQVTAIQDDRSAVSTFENGAMIFRKADGMRQIIATLGAGVQSSFLAPDYVTLETARRNNAI